MADPFEASPIPLDPVHPIDPAVREQILKKLAHLEAERGIRVLYACESGSRGWGFASPDSDYDVRFLYVQPLPWYLGVSAHRDVIELPISDELDIGGWELRKALGLLRKGNATLVEWLDSPVVYRADPDFLPRLQAIARLVHRPERSFFHYLHMAKKNYRQYLQGERVRLKKYLYVLRPILAARWVSQGRGTAPMPFATLVETLVTDPALAEAIAALLVLKRRAGEAEEGAPFPVINAFIEQELAELAKLDPHSPRPDYRILDDLLYQTVTGETPTPPPWVDDEPDEDPDEKTASAEAN